MEETEILKKQYSETSTDYLLKNIPTRSLNAIQKKACRLGLKKNSPDRLSNGTFKRINQPFSLENFNDGYIGSDDRFRVYLPNHPRAYEDGYILRSIVAYELYHKIQVPKTMAIHHIDENRLNDSKENLVMFLFGQHTSFHNEPRREESLISRQCKHCGKIFFIHKFRLNQGLKEGRIRGQFCSFECYQQMPYSEERKKHISKSLKRAYREGRRKNKRGKAGEV